MIQVGVPGGHAVSGKLTFFASFMFKFEKYSLDLMDEPPGWDWDRVEFRHKNLEESQVGHAVLSLLSVSRKVWTASRRKGTAPSVVVTRSK